MPNWSFPTSAGRIHDSAATPESFDLACSCGQQIVGERQAQPQIAECALCRERFLILPVNPYPAPLPPGSTKRKKKSKTSKGGAGFSAAALAAAWSKWGRPVVAVPVSVGKVATRKTVGAGQRLWARTVAIVRAIRAQFTLLRFVVSLIVALIGMTVYWQVRESRLEEAMVVANAAYDRGIEALKQKEILAAYDEFTASKAAMDLLERDDMQARQVRQYAGELTVATQLGTSSLFDVLSEGVKEKRARGVEGWNERFDRQYEGEWLILELAGRGIVSNTDTGTPTVVFPSVFNGEPVVLVLPQTVTRQIPSLDDDVSLIIAAQWDSCGYVETPSPRWLLRFRPETAFLWVNRATYDATGYATADSQPDDDVQRILAQQAQWTGIER